MELTTRHIGAFGDNPAKLIELTINSDNTSITEDVTDLKQMVDYEFIKNLREIADELEEHNQKVANL